MRVNLSDALKEIRAWEEVNPFGSQDGKGKDATVGFVIQSDLAPNYIWIVEEVLSFKEKEADFYGFANLDDDIFAKFGYVALEELLENEQKLALKYDDTHKGKTIVEAMEAYQQKVPEWLLQELETSQEREV